jgi:hypothetical protein
MPKPKLSIGVFLLPVDGTVAVRLRVTRGCFFILFPFLDAFE